jgi:hypothetical protein
MSVSGRQGGHCRKIKETDSIIVYRCKGSEKNGGREQDVTYHKSTQKTTTTDSARADYESKHGKLDKDTDVDHKDNNKHNGSADNLQAMSHKKNVAKGNQHRKKS